MPNFIDISKFENNHEKLKFTLNVSGQIEIHHEYVKDKIETYKYMLVNFVKSSPHV